MARGLECAPAHSGGGSPEQVELRSITVDDRAGHPHQTVPSLSEFYVPATLDDGVRPSQELRTPEYYVPGGDDRAGPSQVRAFPHWEDFDTSTYIEMLQSDDVRVAPESAHESLAHFSHDSQLDQNTDVEEVHRMELDKALELYEPVEAERLKVVQSRKANRAARRQVEGVQVQQRGLNKGPAIITNVVGRVVLYVDSLSAM